MAEQVIELNGKRYDALSGVFLGNGRPAGRPVLSEAAAGHRGRSIDGFVKHAKKASKPGTQAAKPEFTVIPVQPEPHAPRSLPEKPHLLHRAHKLASHANAHQPEHAKTLMRSAVSKPHVKPKPVLKAQLPTEMAPKPSSAIAHPIAHKRSAIAVDKARQARAGQVPKSPAVLKFNRQEQRALPMARTPVAPVQPRSAPRHVVRQQASPKPRSLTKEDIFEAAIAQATSHEELTPNVRRARRSRRRLVNVLAGVGAFLLIGGFIAYLNLPNIELKIASFRAGFHASMPSYRPVGFAMEDSIQTKHDQISLSFRAMDGSYFRLTQRPSTWNSATLYDNIVAISGQQQTIQNNGRTIYVYNGGTNAAWVNGGVWYQISGNAQLSNEQVTRLASSM